MTLQDLIREYGIPSVFHYAAVEENQFEKQAQEVGYTRKTTFFSDLSIAEWAGGESGIRDTFNRVCKEWINNVEYFTEFVMALNWKSWEWSARENNEWTQLYVELYEKAYDKGINKYKGKDADYFWSTLD